MMKYFFIIVNVVIFFNSTAISQIIHKDDIKNFVGVLKTTPLNEPRERRDNHKIIVEQFSKSKYEANKPLSTSFETYDVTTKIDSMEKRYPHTWDSSSTYSVIRYPDNPDLKFQLYLKQNYIYLIFFHNGMFEGGTSYLTLWREIGDSLVFIKLYQMAFRVGIGYISFPGDYVINENQEFIFVTFSASGDNLSSYGRYDFYYLDKEYILTELLSRTFFADYDRKHQSTMVYKFLDMRTLLLHKYDFTYQEYKESFYTFMDRKMYGSTFELINLKQIYDQIKQQR